MNIRDYIEKFNTHYITSWSSDGKRCSLYNDTVDFFYMRADNANAIIEEISIRGRWVNPGGSRELGKRSVGKRVIPLCDSEEIPLIDKEISSELLKGVPKITKTEYSDDGYTTFTYTLDLGLEYIICERYHIHTDESLYRDLNEYMSGSMYPLVFRIIKGGK